MKTVEELRKTVKEWMEYCNKNAEHYQAKMSDYMDSRPLFYDGEWESKYVYNNTITKYHNYIIKWMDKSAIYKSLLDIALLEDSMEKMETYVRKLIQFHRESKIELQSRAEGKSFDLMDCIEHRAELHEMYETELTYLYNFVFL